MKRSAFVVVALALAATAVFSKVSPMALEELFWESEIVAIGYDARLFREHGWQVAEFSITRVLKGSAEPRVKGRPN